MGEQVITKIEAEQIADKAATAALDRFVANMPLLLRPTIAEVVKEVSTHQSEKMDGIFRHIFGVDIADIESVQAMQSNMKHLRVGREGAEANKRTLKESLISSVVSSLVTGIISVGATIGVGLFILYNTGVIGK